MDPFKAASTSSAEAPADDRDELAPHIGTCRFLQARLLLSAIERPACRVGRSTADRADEPFEAFLLELRFPGAVPEAPAQDPPRRTARARCTTPFAAVACITVDI
jgi:hypothetical protein